MSGQTPIQHTLGTSSGSTSTKMVTTSSSSCSYDGVTLTLEGRRGPKAPSRKRNLAWIGSLVGVAVAAAVVPLPQADASPVYQHRVGRAHRHVTYQHVIDKVPRGSSSYPSYYDDDDYDDDNEKNGRVLAERIDGREDGHVHLSLLADASVQSPHDFYPYRQYLVAKKEQEKRQLRHTANNNQHQTDRLRRTLVSEKFVVEDNTAVLQDDVFQDDNRSNSPMHAIQNTTDPNEFHDTMIAGFNVTAEVLFNVSSPEEYRNNYTDTASSVLTGSTNVKPTQETTREQEPPQPLRIRALLSEQRDGGEFLTAFGRETLLQEILRPALLSWSAALRVEPVIGNLTVDPQQLYDGQSCGPGQDSGLPSPKVPAYHLTEGLMNTDMILYVSLGYVPGNWSYNKNYTRTMGNQFHIWNVTEDEDVEDEDDDEAKKESALSKYIFRMPQSAQENDGPQWQQGTSQESSASSPPTCSGEYVAAAAYCSTDQYDRPTAGMLHICIDDTFFRESTRERQILTMMHEIGHALGFNSRSMAHFRRPNGDPITPRVNGEIVETEVECTGPKAGREFAKVALPSEEILQFRTVRGGVRVAEVVTPSVLQVVRNHFDCQELPGAELESGVNGNFPLSGEDLEEQACIGDHWERRLFRNDLMNPVVDDVIFSPFISTITLAYFADSGWYQVDLSMSEFSSSWGRGAGCGFVEETCIGEDGQVPPSNEPFFCNSVPKLNKKGLAAEIQGCTPDLSRKATCSLGQYDLELPPEYQYFGLTYGVNVGGNDPFIDYCPTFTGFDNGLCSNKENAALLQINRVERFGQRNSRCLSALVNEQRVAWCLPIACVAEDRSLHVKVNGEWRLCKSKEQELQVSSGLLGEEWVQCPDPRRVCPTFYCQHDCLGTPGGLCDYETGRCTCGENATKRDIVGASGSLNSSDASFECISRDAGSGVYTRWNRTLAAMPQEGSPLSDYYVPYMAELHNDGIHFEPWEIAIICLSVLVIISAIAVYIHWRRSARRSNADVFLAENHAELSTNPNKDKMIATVLVDMRIRGSNRRPESVAPTSEASSLPSLSEVELCSDRQSVRSDFPSSVGSMDENSQAGSEGRSPLYEDVLDGIEMTEIRPQCIVRRRITHADAGSTS